MPIPYPELMESSGTPRTNRIRRPYHFQLPHPSFLQDPTRALLEFLGVVPGGSAHSPLSSSSSSSHSLENESSSPPPSRRNATIRDSSSSEVGGSRGEPEVSINISTVRETEETRIASREQSNNTNNNNSVNAINDINNNIGINGINNTNNFNNSNDTNSINGVHAINNNDAINSLPVDTGTNLHLSSNNNNNNNNNERDSQRYDMQQLARWIEQVLPFLVLLLMVFIRQHIEGFLVTLWISAVMIKSNDILRKQTALKGERKNLTIITIGLGMLLQITGIYWWFKEEDLFRPLLLLAPKEIPKFWHSIFIILVNDTLIRQGAMVLKCGLLLHYKKARGRQYHRQGQLLTLVEYFVLLYRALLPAPVWYRFFLNKEYGNLFSSLTTGLYLTFKLTSVLEKLQTFLAALKALTGREVQYGSYATAEEVIIAGDLCAICQEKMHAPILLSCKHLFCEDCVSEWFDREKTCPLCRAVVKPTEFQSFSDGSTSLLYQVF